MAQYSSTLLLNKNNNSVRWVFWVTRWRSCLCSLRIQVPPLCGSSREQEGRRSEGGMSASRNPWFCKAASHLCSPSIREWVTWPHVMLSHTSRWATRHAEGLGSADPPNHDPHPWVDNMSCGPARHSCPTVYAWHRGRINLRLIPNKLLRLPAPPA